MSLTLGLGKCCIFIEVRQNTICLMKCFKLPPVLDSREVLLDHLKVKLKHIQPLLLIVDDLAVELCENRSNKEITNLLQSEDSLRNAILNM